MAFGDLCGCKIHYKNIIYLISFCEVRLHFPPVFHEQFTLFKDKKRRLGILFFEIQDRYINLIYNENI